MSFPAHAISSYGGKHRRNSTGMSAASPSSASAAAANLSSLFLKKTERYSKTELKLLQELFEVADKDKDGKLDAGELSGMFRDRGLDVSEEEVREVIDAVDANRDK